MEIMKKILIGLLLFCLLVPSPAYAGNDPIIKFSRGLTNIITAPWEYFIQTCSLRQDHDALTSLFAGLLRGTLFTVARELTGVYDVATFLIPLPSNYQPLWKPETVFEAFEEIHPTERR
ncbi:MAG TPA: exosortase system-associated protein, TIGR04073 family [Candidatus Omnitrophota bacterium]|nr:exosortase system-associated protein, TIGR04073 family [Candidatus Omnitrophota bacterium]